MVYGKRWKIAQIGGVPLYISSSWIWMAAFFVWLVDANVSLFRDVSAWEALGLSLLNALLFFGAILVHEAAHAAMARALGLPVCGITLLFWGGATETKTHGRGAGGEFLVSMVGPLATLGMAGVFSLLAGATSGVMRYLIAYLAHLSLLFAAFNALPGYPLDGGRMLMAAIWGATKNRRTAMRATGYTGIAVGAGLGYLAFLDFQRHGGWWPFLGIVAFTMIATSRGMDKRIALHDQLADGTAADAMRPAPPAVPAALSLSQTLDTYLRGAPDQAFPVVEDGLVIGTISIESARKVGTKDPLRPTREGTAPLSTTAVVTPDEHLADVVEWLHGRDGLVVADGALLGAIGPDDIERWYRRKVLGEREDTGAWGVESSPPGPPPRPDL